MEAAVARTTATPDRRAGAAARACGGLSLQVARAADAAVLPVAIGLLAYAAVAQGGFYRTQGSFFAAALLALALASVRSAAGLGPLLAAAALLSGGVLASGLASGWGANAPQIVAALGAGIAIVPVVRHLVARGERARLLDAVSWIGAGAAIVGLIGVAFHRSPWAMPAGGLWRASSTLTYANAAGSLLLLTLGTSMISLVERPGTARRLAAFATLAGLAATLSRGAVVGALAGLVVLAALRGLSLLRPLLRPAIGALVAFACVVPSIAGPPRPLLAFAGLAAGAAIAVAPGRRATSSRIRRATLAVAAIAGISLLASAGAGRVLDNRVPLASETRLRTWGNSWRLALQQPLLGAGPGTFAIVENDPRTGPVLTRYVHNEYLQAFVETGAAGVAAIAGAIAILAGWAWRRRRDDGAWALACAMCAAFAVHSGFDFLWRLPVLAALAFVWLAIAVTPPPEGGGTR